MIDDTNWREEYMQMKVLKKRQIELLTKPIESLSASWLINAMKQDWKVRKLRENKV